MRENEIVLFVNGSHAYELNGRTSGQFRHPTNPRYINVFSFLVFLLTLSSQFLATLPLLRLDETLDSDLSLSLTHCIIVFTRF